MTDPTPADAARDWPVETPKKVIMRYLDEYFHMIEYTPESLSNDADWLLKDFNKAGYEIVQRGDGVRVDVAMAKNIEQMLRMVANWEPDLHSQRDVAKWLLAHLQAAIAAGAEGDTK